MPRSEMLRVSIEARLILLKVISNIIKERVSYIGRTAARKYDYHGDRFAAPATENEQKQRTPVRACK